MVIRKDISIPRVPCVLGAHADRSALIMRRVSGVIGDWSRTGSILAVTQKASTGYAGEGFIVILTPRPRPSMGAVKAIRLLRSSRRR